MESILPAIDDDDDDDAGEMMITSMSKQGTRWKGKVKRRGLCVTVPVSAGRGVCVSVKQRALLHYLTGYD